MLKIIASALRCASPPVRHPYYHETLWQADAILLREKPLRGFLRPIELALLSLECKKLAGPGAAYRTFETLKLLPELGLCEVTHIERGQQYAIVIRPVLALHQNYGECPMKVAWISFGPSSCGTRTARRC
jgi:hypothetical protein